MRVTRILLFVALVFTLAAFTGSPVLAAILERGPYLQQVTTGSVTVRWRTDNVTDAVVRYGLAPDTLDSMAIGDRAGTDHEVTPKNTIVATANKYGNNLAYPFGYRE